MTWLVIGLGNPGSDYANTRHNVGFMTADELARRAAVGFSVPRRMRAQVAMTRMPASGVLGGVGDCEPVAIVKPITFMNDSGVAVRKLTDFHGVGPDHVIVVHDELDLDLGRLRVKQGGGDNGHNGLKSIRAHLGTGDFFRVRIGIGRPPGRQDAADYVLSQIPKALLEDVGAQTRIAADAVEALLSGAPLACVQNRFNN